MACLRITFSFLYFLHKSFIIDFSFEHFWTLDWGLLGFAPAFTHTSPPFNAFIGYSTLE